MKNLMPSMKLEFHNSRDSVPFPIENKLRGTRKNNFEVHVLLDKYSGNKISSVLSSFYSMKTSRQTTDYGDK